MRKTHIVYDEVNHKTVFAGTEDECEDFILENGNFRNSVQMMSDGEKMFYNLHEKENLVAQ